MNETAENGGNQNDDESIFQDKYKVVSEPLPEVRDAIDQLDIILTVLDDDNWKPHSFHHIRHYILNKRIRILDKDLEIAVEKLCDDKYVSVIEQFDGRSPVQKYQNVPVPANHYRISYEGRFFISKVRKKYKGRPYRNQKATEAWNNFYIKAKAVASVVSTVAIIVIGAWGVYVADKSSKFESTIDALNSQVQKKNIQIDSLRKLTSDTVKVKIK